MRKKPRFAIDCPKCGGRCRINGGAYNGSDTRYCTCTVCSFRFCYENGEIRRIGEGGRTLSDQGGIVVKPEPKTPPRWKVRQMLAGVTTPALRERLERWA